MASIFKRKGSTSLQLATILPKTGKRRTLSLHTGQAEIASSTADTVQKLCDELSKDQVARQTVLKVLVEDIFIAAQVPNPWDLQTGMAGKTLSGYVAEYLSRLTLAKTSLQFATSTLSNFTDCHYPLYLEQVTGDQCQQWYDGLIASVSAATANNRLSCVSAMFSQAKKLGLIASNPCSGVQIKASAESAREELTDAEICRLCNYLEGVPKGKSWITAVYLARYAGLRLMDAANLESKHVVNAGDGLALFFVARKTGSEVTVPCVSVLAQRLRHVMATSYGADALCPGLNGRASSSLSTEFVDLLEAAGIDTGKTEVNGRVKRSKGFHSLRVSFVSWLTRAGVPEDLRMSLAGHTTKKAHKVYIRQDGEDLANRLNRCLNSANSEAP